MENTVYLLLWKLHTLVNVKLAIVNVTMSAGGSYSCTATSMSNSHPSLVRTPLLQFDFCTVPIITGTTATSNPQFDERFFMECTIDGLPIPTVTWFKDGAQLNETDDTNIRILTTPAKKSSRFEVTMARADYNGEYRCVASNVAGSTSESFQIELQGLPATTVSTIIIAVLTIAFVILCVIMLFFIFTCCRKKTHAVMDLPVYVGPEPDELLQMDTAHPVTEPESVANDNSYCYDTTPDMDLANKTLFDLAIHQSLAESNQQQVRTDSSSACESESSMSMPDSHTAEQCDVDDQ